jgi:hypothetical protein
MKSIKQRNNLEKRGGKTMKMVGKIFVLLVILIGGFTMSVTAEEDYGIGNKKPIPRSVYWGDTHLHTSFSPDANLTGNVKLGPAEARLRPMSSHAEARSRPTTE